MRETYADHAATSFPKPPEVLEAMVTFLREIGCSPGRGGYRKSLDAARLVYETRTLLASFFNVPQPEQIIFTSNVTAALNLVVKGLLTEGDHVIISSMEHNAVLRPLARLACERNIRLERLPCAADGTLDSGVFKAALRPDTRLAIITHASNVTGSLLPVYEIGEILKNTDTYYCVDAAQTAGTLSINYADLNCDYLAFTGHKGMLGPPGIGGVCISERAAAATAPLVEGGTGSRSEDETQPGFLPDKFESGTQNVPGIAGLAAGIRYLQTAGLTNIQLEKQKLTEIFLAGAREIPGLKVYGPGVAGKMVSTLSVNMEGIDNADLSFMLEQAYGIMTRSGLHCAPLAHRTIGTFPVGTTRFSFGYQNTPADIDYILSALREIANERLGA
jgi:cysteine desulfurase family protein